MLEMISQPYMLVLRVTKDQVAVIAVLFSDYAISHFLLERSVFQVEREQISDVADVHSYQTSARNR